MNKTVKLNNGKMRVENSGRFQLKVNADPSKFRLTNINAFVPYGQNLSAKKTFMTESGEVDTLMIDKLITNFYPDEKMTDEHNVAVLIQHPQVYIEGTPDEEWKKLVSANIKKEKSDFILTNIDKVKNAEFDSETELINARYILYRKENPISVERLIWLCTRFDIGTRTNIQNEEQKRKHYIKLLDRWLEIKNPQTGKLSNIEAFIDAIDNIKETEYIYYIDKLRKLEIIKDYSGIFKVGDKPIGSTIKHIIQFYEENQDIFTEHKKSVIQSENE